jgi:organic radical activating enzyme
MDEIEKFIDASVKSGYQFDFLLTGGEPLLWKHLDEALKALRASGIVKSVSIFTNAMLPNKVTTSIMDNTDRLRISLYDYNKQQTNELVQRFGCKVQVVDRTGFWKNPETPVPDEIALPMVCMNAEFLYYNYEVYACPHALSIVKHNGSKVPICKPLEINFLEGIMDMKEGQAKEICTMCISNKRVRDYVMKIHNVDKRRTAKASTDA